MMIIAVAMFVTAGLLLGLAAYVGAVLAYDELTGHRRIIEAQEARALAQRAAKYPWAKPVAARPPVKLDSWASLPAAA